MIDMVKSAIFVFAFLLIVSTVGNSQSVGAPPIYEVKFVNGVYVDKASVFLHSPCPSNAPQGVCGNGDSRRYSLNGKAGDQITISLISDEKTAVFSIFYTDQNVLPNGSAVSLWSGKLKSDANFGITVYTNKGSTPYTMRITRTRNGRRH